MYHEATTKNWTTFVLFYPLKKLLLLEGVLDLPDFQEFGSRTEMLEKKKTLLCVICFFEKTFFRASIVSYSYQDCL